VFCGEPIEGEDEGYGQKIICSFCLSLIGRKKRWRL
jgi:hypothetical protein